MIKSNLVKVDKTEAQESGTSDILAELRARAEVEPIASYLGMKLLELSPGYARVAMKLMPEHLNFQGLVYGGIIMAIADYAFAYAGNASVYPSVASQFNIHFISGPKVGDKLTAECWVVKGGRRVVIVDVTVSNQEGKLIAKATATGVPVGKQTKT